MRKLMILCVLCLCGSVLGGCANGKVAFKDSNLVAAYQRDLDNSKACMTDADCTAIAKGCCLCDGQEAVNKKYEAKLSKQREKACGVGPCTLQMCYVEIDTSCQNGKCVGTPKPYKDYFVK